MSALGLEIISKLNSYLLMTVICQKNSENTVRRYIIDTQSKTLVTIATRGVVILVKSILREVLLHHRILLKTGLKKGN